MDEIEQPLVLRRMQIREEGYGVPAAFLEVGPQWILFDGMLAVAKVDDVNAMINTLANRGISFLVEPS